MNKVIALLFILTSSISFSQDKEDCPDIKTGFYGYTGDIRSTIIYRTKKSQIEYNLNDDSWLILTLDWISDCEYHYTFFKVSSASAKELIGFKNSAIVLSHDDKGYNYKSIPLNNNLPTMTGKIFYRNDIPKKIQKKLKKVLKKNT
ncbi:MAG: hypothetical protein ACJASQ_003484 [Crocinitomicaceae bacterium]|jgi:hypothetical protein